MKDREDRRAEKQAAACAEARSTVRRVLKAQAVVLGVLALALFVREIPSLVREMRICRMTGGMRACRRYP